MTKSLRGLKLNIREKRNVIMEDVQFLLFYESLNRTEPRKLSLKVECDI